MTVVLARLDFLLEVLTELEELELLLVFLGWSDVYVNFRVV